MKSIWKKAKILLGHSVGPILSLIAFVLTFYMDPLNFKMYQPIAALPAFYVSIIILLISQKIEISQDVKKGVEYSDNTCEAVKGYLHVTTLGSPTTAMKYIVSRLPALREARNTSFSIEGFTERADERFYETSTYKIALDKIGEAAFNGLMWKDIGDHFAKERFGYIYNKSLKETSDTSSYKYRFISNNVPQMNFIILEYNNGNKEVLFNWDFRRVIGDPSVLISRDSQIVEMFEIQFARMWDIASPDYDIIATKSTPTK